MVRITVVNDNPELLALFGAILHGDRYRTTLIESNRDDLLPLIRLSEPDLLVIDLRRGREPLYGWQIAMKVRESAGGSALPVLICSADLQALSDLEPDVSATPRVAAIQLPFEIDGLIASIDGLTGGQEAAERSKDRI